MTGYVGPIEKQTTENTWKKEKSRRVRPSTVCLKKEGGQIKRPKWARTTCQTH
jgi:hypothetical protein